MSAPASPRDVHNGDNTTTNQTPEQLTSHIQWLRNEVSRLKHQLSMSQQERKYISFTIYRRWCDLRNLIRVSFPLAQRKRRWRTLPRRRSTSERRIYDYSDGSRSKWSVVKPCAVIYPNLNPGTNNSTL